MGPRFIDYLFKNEEELEAKKRETFFNLSQKTCYIYYSLEVDLRSLCHPRRRSIMALAPGSLRIPIYITIYIIIITIYGMSS
jgi:hypothetical protein